MERITAVERTPRRAALRSFASAVIGGAALATVGCGRNNSSSSSITVEPGSTDIPSPSSSVAPSAQPAHSPLYFPPSGSDTWEAINVKDAGWDETALTNLTSYLADHSSYGFLLLSGGRIVIEQYWAPFRRHAVGDVASAQKSVTSLLIGILEAQGALRLDDPASKYLGAGWTKASAMQESAITLRHLLTMTSGLSDSFTFEAAAGTRWSYNTSAYQMLPRVVEKASGKPLDDFTHTALAPLGWQDSLWRDRPNMKLPDGSPARGLAMSSRDAARFGLMVLAGGAWAGQQVVPPAYLQAALTPSTTLNPSYGYLWWLNGEDGYVLPGPSVLRDGPLIPTAPKDLVAAMGANEQRIYVVPSLNLVGVRQGLAAQPGAAAEALSSFDQDFWTKLMAAVPGHHPNP